MKPVINCLVALVLSILLMPAYAAWGDVSYDPNPAKIDEDNAAQFDIFGFFTHVVIGGSGLSSAAQNFENGFSSGQLLYDWVALGSTRVRFGFGNTLSTTLWNSAIGGIDPSSTNYSLIHPHGLYGNAPGVADRPRNYVADLHFLTADSTRIQAPPRFFVMQFAQPVTFLSFVMIDYGSGGSFNFSLWNGSSLDDLVKVDQKNEDRSVKAGQDNGSFEYLVSNTPIFANPPHRPTFNFAIVRLDTADATVGFDNFTVGLAPIPEPETFSLMCLGLLMLGLAKRRLGTATAKTRGRA